MDLALILGTRPEIIKFSPIVRYLEEEGIPYYTIHTGQHYSFEMDRIFFEELELPPATYSLNVGSGSHGAQTGKMIPLIEETLLTDPVHTALVQGDTNTVMAGAIAASKINVRLGHVEAGLRSYDRRMPEEVNRIVADHLSDLLFAPTDVSRGYLVHEGIEQDKIHVTGNTVVDAVMQNIEIAQEKADIGALRPKRDYILVTTHRQENVDDPTTLTAILAALDALASHYDMDILFPAHPRTRKMMARYGLNASPRIIVTDPVGYLSFLQLEREASLIVTDSGGIQEEACVLQVPCITIRENTERPETIDVGANMLVGTSQERILKGAHAMLGSSKKWNNPFGDGTSGKRIVNICVNK